MAAGSEGAAERACAACCCAHDLKLTDALIGSFENDPGSKGVETALTFHYDSATLTDASSPRVTAEWSTTTNTDTAVVGDSVSSASSTSDGGFAAVAAPTNSPVRYFLKVDGVTGDVTDKAHKGWFAVDGYDIGVTTPFSSAAGTEVTGRTQFSPFCMDYEPFRVRRGWSARRTGR